MDKLVELLAVTWSDLKTMALGFMLCLLLFLPKIPSTGPVPDAPPPVPGPVIPPKPVPAPEPEDVPVEVIAPTPQSEPAKPHQYAPPLPPGYPFGPKPSYR